MEIVPAEVIVEGRRVMICPMCDQSLKSKAGWTKHIEASCNSGKYDRPRVLDMEPSFHIAFPPASKSGLSR